LWQSASRWKFSSEETILVSGIIHISDLHLGGVAEPMLLEAVQDLVPDLEPQAIVLSGDLCLRARHGEFLAARGFLRDLGRTAPVVAIPGNHDVQWWRRPFLPFGASAKYQKYEQYFGPILNPTLSLPGVLIASALTAHGVAWGSLTPRLRDIAVKGHLTNNEASRIKTVFDKAEPTQFKALVVHHNVLRGEISERMGLARWKQAQKRIVESGAELVLCGHDHQECAEVLDGKVVVSGAGTLCSRTRGGRPSVFHRIRWDQDSIHVEMYKWDSDLGLFKRNDVHAFGRVAKRVEGAVAAKQF
jgi:3',5'-cyclic AMP phosphodiesterase CpdA